MRLKTWWQGLRQPSLARRLVWAVALAFGLVLLVLMAAEYGQYREKANSQTVLLKACDHLAEAIEHAPDAHSATQIAVAAERVFNASRADYVREQGRRLEPLLFELVDPATGQRLHASAALAGVNLQTRAGHAQQQTLGGQVYWVAANDTRYGQLRIAEAVLADRTVLSWLLADLLPDLLLALPFVMLPVWLAVRQGLQPLRRLARQIEQRGRDDFSPLGEPLQHAELRPLVAAFDTLLARLRSAVARERRFVQDAAHELRTPLAVISAQAHVLTRAGNDAERQQAGAALDSAIARASHLSQQLLALAALDEHRAPAVQAADLCALTQQALAERAATAQARQIQLGLNAPEHVPVALDIGAYHSILHNLLDNALRYIPAGGHIEVSLAASAGGWQLSVADDGPGIAPEDRERLFERFVHGRAAGATGTGLGLAIVRQAAQRLGGEVSVGSGLQARGAGFHVRVPAGHAAVEASASAP